MRGTYMFQSLITNLELSFTEKLLRSMDLFQAGQPKPHTAHAAPPVLRCTARRAAPSASRAFGAPPNHRCTVRVLQALNGTEKGRLTKSLVKVTFAVGEPIISQGDVGDAFFIIRSGAAKVVIDKDGEEIVLRERLAPPEYFGNPSPDPNPHP